MRGIYSGYTQVSLQSGWKFLRGARSREPTDSWKWDSPLGCNGCQPVCFQCVKVSYSHVETALKKQKQMKQNSWHSFGVPLLAVMPATLSCFKFGTSYNVLHLFIFNMHHWSVKVKAPQMLLNLVVGGPLHGHSRFLLVTFWQPVFQVWVLVCWAFLGAWPDHPL